MPYAYICICDACATAKNARKKKRGNETVSGLFLPRILQARPASSDSELH